MVQRAVLDTRGAVRGALAGLEAASTVLVALSGGADSLALAAAVAYEAPRVGLNAGAVVVDHGLQEGSAEVAKFAAETASGLGLDPVLVRRVEVARDAGGPEAAARDARYRAVADAAAGIGAATVLTAHTRDDQAEQVLLGLARGSGLRSLAGIPSERSLGDARVLRPFLDERAGVTRATTVQACAELGLEPWHDPHNADPSYARVRVRESVIPHLEQQLGPGVAAALARTADLVREDADALDALAADLAAELAADPAGQRQGSGGSIRIPAERLAQLPPALRNRVIRHIARERFGAHLSRERTLAIAALVTDWRGQGPIEAPGVTASRAEGLLAFRAPTRRG